MANLVATPGWDDVYEIKTSDWIMAGETGIANRQAQALLNKTEYLKQLLEDALINIETIDPIGTIKLFFGASQNIPAGWQICNGTNGTPNLKNKYVIGAGNSYSLGQNVGSNILLQTVSTDIYSTNPSLSISWGGAHTHRLVMANNTSTHYHTVSIGSQYGSYYYNFKPRSGKAYPAPTGHTHASVEVSATHTHTHTSLETSKNGQHLHRVDIEYNDSVMLNPSLTLFYIMRVS
jgi:hypothetical protein